MMSLAYINDDDKLEIGSLNHDYLNTAVDAHQICENHFWVSWIMTLWQAN